MPPSRPLQPVAAAHRKTAPAVFLAPAALLVILGIGLTWSSASTNPAIEELPLLLQAGATLAFAFVGFLLVHLFATDRESRNAGWLLAALLAAAFAGTTAGQAVHFVNDLTASNAYSLPVIYRSVKVQHQSKKLTRYYLEVETSPGRTRALRVSRDIAAPFLMPRPSQTLVEGDALRLTMAEGLLGLPRVTALKQD